MFARANGSITALVKAENIKGQDQPANPSYPFVRCGPPSAVPLEYSCVNGSTVTMDMHAFAQNEDEAAAIGAELVLQFDDVELPLDNGSSAKVRWTGGQNLRDPEDESLWHAVRTFDFEAME